ncbi:hypothetical protein BH11CYA1_BH11CYA1_33200 [soil metagenome]
MPKVMQSLAVQPLVRPLDLPLLDHSVRSIEIGPLDFDGPFFSHLEVKEAAGILATLVLSGESYELVYVYSTANLRAAALLELYYVRQNNPTVAVATFVTKELQPEVSAALASLVWQGFK